MMEEVLAKAIKLVAIGPEEGLDLFVSRCLERRAGSSVTSLELLTAHQPRADYRYRRHSGGIGRLQGLPVRSPAPETATWLRRKLRHTTTEMQGQLLPGPVGGFWEDAKADRHGRRRRFGRAMEWLEPICKCV